MKKFIAYLMAIVVICLMLGSCTYETSSTRDDVKSTLEAGNTLSQNQPTPTDIEYSLERWNLIRRTYWVNGMRERALAEPCPIADCPLGYVILFSGSGSIIGQFTIDGKVTSLNSYLTPDSEYYEQDAGSTTIQHNEWLPDVDGAYGYNDNGIFFFTTDGKYMEWNGTYLFSDIPFQIDDPVLVTE